MQQVIGITSCCVNLEVRRIMSGNSNKTQLYPVSCTSLRASCVTGCCALLSVSQTRGWDPGKRERKVRRGEIMDLIRQAPHPRVKGQLSHFDTEREWRIVVIVGSGTCRTTCVLAAAFGVQWYLRGISFYEWLDCNPSSNRHCPRLAPDPDQRETRGR